MTRVSVFTRVFIVAVASMSLVPSGRVVAQGSDLMSDGILAFREERYEDAARAFERLVDANPDNAEAHFLLARVYFETPLRDVRRAGREIDRALKIEPDNVQYLVARLEQLRVEANNFVVEKIREEKRRRLSYNILKLDSTNSFAHEELGISYIRDFWRYRNAVSLPTLKFANPNYELQRTETIEPPSFDPATTPVDYSLLAGSAVGVPVDGEFAPDIFNVDDEFDLDRFSQQGYPIQDLSKRADKAYTRALYHLETSLKADPRRRSVYENLLRIHALKNDSDAGLKLLSRMFQYFPEDAFLWSNFGFAHYQSGNMAASAVSFKKALELMRDDERNVYESIEYILPAEERDAYRGDPRTYSSRFWTSKDPRYLTPYNERKLAHYSRIVYADLLYSAPDIKKRGWETDRGKILIRYGVPKADVTWMATGSVNDVSLIQTAVYGSAEATHFAADMVKESNRYNIWEYGDFRFVFEDPLNNGRFLFYSPSAAELGTGRFGQAWTNDYEIKSRETFRKYPDRYDYEPPGRRIELPFIVSSFRGDEGQADVYVHYGIPVNDYEPTEDLIELTASVGTFLINENRDLVVERRKTLYGLRTSQIVHFGDVHLWVASEKVVAPSGPHDVSMEFETASGSTVAIQRRAVEVPEFPSDRLALSDVLLAYRVEETESAEPVNGSEIVRSGLSMTPAPWSVFDVRQPIYLYFEVYNLEQNAAGETDFEVEAVLSPKDDKKGIAGFVKGIFGGGKKGVSVMLPVTGASSDDHQYLILDAANQETGVYTLRVKLKDNLSGKSAEKEKDLFLE